MSKGDPPFGDEKENERKQERSKFRSHNLSLVVGDPNSDGSSGDELQDMRSRMQSFAVNVDADGMPPATIFVEDSDVILPSTSQTSDFYTVIQSAEFTGCPVSSTADQLSETKIDMGDFVKNFFAFDKKFLHATNQETAANFVEEVFTEKPPKILNDYLFGIVIGEGSYSKVKEVLHVRTLIRRAVKIIKDKRLRKIPGGEQNVQREIEVLQRLNHPNVVKVVDIFRIEEKQKLYIVMEFCVCSLQQMLDNCTEKMLPEFQAHLYFSQLLNGLDFLHSKRIIHKDIKPGNLLLSLDGCLKICDLGVAELLSPVMNETDWCTLVQGTPKFQPPEVVSGTQKRFRGTLVDIWASGVTLYNIVSGEYPFEGDVILKLFENITTCPLRMPDSIKLSAELEQMLGGMLEKDPGRRWNSFRIRACKWFTKEHQVNKNRIVHVPATKDIPAHRPISMYHCLNKLYGATGSDCSEKNSEIPIGQNCDKITAGLDDMELGDSLVGRLEECTPILGSRENSNAQQLCQEGIQNQKSLSSERKRPQQRSTARRKLSVALLRQILFIVLCSLIVLASVLVLMLML